MAALIPIKKSGFIFSLRFHRNGADSAALPAAITPNSGQMRKSRVSIKSYGDSAGSKQQSGRGWNEPSGQLKYRSSEGLDCHIQRIVRILVVLMNPLQLMYDNYRESFFEGLSACMQQSSRRLKYSQKNVQSAIASAPPYSSSCRAWMCNKHRKIFGHSDSGSAQRSGCTGSSGFHSVAGRRRSWTPHSSSSDKSRLGF
jgi:hypothetical protein